MGPKSRANLKRCLKRLETCFDINYEFYYGDISKEKYDFLFNELELLIERRFNQRCDVYSLKSQWSFLKHQSYNLILKKKASLFVIYDENKPIDICLNYHFQNVMCHLVRSYDIDYSKYRIGQIDIYKQIEWCFLSNFKIFDFMWGELFYKKHWSNKISFYEHHFIYKNSFLNDVFVQLMIKMYKTNDTLKEKKFYKSFIKAKNTIVRSLQSKTETKQPTINFESIIKMPLSKNSTKIKIKNESYKFLRKTVYDFQYLNFENSSNISVYKLDNQNKLFIIKGSKFQIKVTVT